MLLTLLEKNLGNLLAGCNLCTSEYNTLEHKSCNSQQLKAEKTSKKNILHAAFWKDHSCLIKQNFNCMYFLAVHTGFENLECYSSDGEEALNSAQVC